MTAVFGKTGALDHAGLRQFRTSELLQEETEGREKGGFSFGHFSLFALLPPVKMIWLRLPSWEICGLGSRGSGRFAEDQPGGQHQVVKAVLLGPVLASTRLAAARPS